jgi:hypothetical protein
MGKFGTKKAAVKKGNTNAAKGSQQEPITDASGAATRALRHLLPVAVPPASSTEAEMETAADYQGGIRNDDEVLPPGQSAIESITIRQPHPLMQQRKQWRTMRVEGNGMI